MANDTRFAISHDGPDAIYVVNLDHISRASFTLADGTPTTCHVWFDDGSQETFEGPHATWLASAMGAVGASGTVGAA